MEDIETQIEQLRANRGKNRIEDYDKEDMLLNEGEAAPKKEDGVLGVLLFQCIIVVLLAILYVLMMSFQPPIAYEIKNTVMEKSANDFSFKDQVYDTVGNVLTYLNQIEPIDIGETGSVSDSDMTASDVMAKDKVSEQTSSENNTSSGSEGESDTGAGGEPNPVSGTEMPQNATFAPVIFTGRITFPIEKNYHITSQFGFRDHPSQGIDEFHTAVDIGAPKGTAVLAAADGVVIKSEKGASLGNYIIIDHSNGFLTVYGHCDKLIAKVGAHIREGEVIAKVGSTGDSTGNHLHFGMKKDDLYFDPSYVFKEELNA